MCLAGQPRYLTGGDGEQNPLPPELHPLGIVANASKADRERLAAKLRAARAEGTLGVHVVTMTAAGLHRKDPNLPQSSVMHCEQHDRACPVDRCEHTRLHTFTASDRDRVTRRCDQCGTEFHAVRRDARYCRQQCRRTASRTPRTATDNAPKPGVYGPVSPI